MNRNNLDKIIEQYVEQYDIINAPEEQGGNDEGYKWRVIDSFKKHWDVNAADFKSMFNEATDEVGKTNLLNNTVLPLQGISDLMLQFDEEEFVREQFQKLFSDDNGDIIARGNRVFAFVDAMNRKIEENFPGSWKYKQNTFSAVFYLNLWKPDSNYIYRATEAHEWADCIEYADDFGTGSSFSLSKYYVMMDELRGELHKYPELMRLHKKHMDDGHFCFDDDMHLLAFDIVFCSHYKRFYNECPVLGVPTKDRIRIAKAKEEIEEAEDEMDKINERIAALKKALLPTPSLIHLDVSHKKYGNGKVIAEEDDRFIVRFPDREIKFNTTSILEGFITLPGNVKDSFLKNKMIQNEIDRLGSRIDLIRHKYDL